MEVGYLCNDCGVFFPAPELKEEDCGLIGVCPSCGSEEWEELDEFE